MELKELLFRELPKLKEGYFYCLQWPQTDADLIIVKNENKIKTEVAFIDCLSWDDDLEALIKFMKQSTKISKYLAKEK